MVLFIFRLRVFFHLNKCSNVRHVTARLPQGCLKATHILTTTVHNLAAGLYRLLGASFSTKLT